MSYIKELSKSIEDGISGKSEGIPFKLERLNYDVPGIQKARINVVAGGTGSGKSKLLNEVYMFTAIDDWITSGKSYTLKIYYFSLEIPKEQILAAYAIRWLQNKHKIIIDTKYLLGFNREIKVTEYIQDLLRSDEFKQAMSDFEEAVDIMDYSINSISFDNFVRDKADEHGNSITEEIEIKGKSVNKFIEYEENDPSQRIMFIVDHIALVKTIAGQNKKAMIDEMSKAMIKYRNRYKFIFCVAQQLNRSFGTTDRQKLEDLLPKDSDLKESGDLAEAADLIFGIMSPYRERQNSFLGYKVSDTPMQEGLKGRMIVLNLIKNRFGEVAKVYPLLFLGETGYFSHLPVNPEGYDYDLVLSKIKEMKQS